MTEGLAVVTVAGLSERERAYLIEVVTPGRPGDDKIHVRSHVGLHFP